MFRRFVFLALILTLLTPSALAGEAPNYEISSYVLYMNVQDDGAVRVREEIIYNNPSAYEGLSIPVSLKGTDGLSEAAVWCDGEVLEELSSADALEEDARGFIVTSEGDDARIDIVCPGDSDSHAFACAYTLKELARRYEDTALLDRVLIPSGREVMLQNAVVIVTLPRSDGEVLAYVDGAPEEIPLLVKYDTVNIGPIDVAADEALSAQLLFPADWLDAAETVPQAMREAVIAPRRKAEENTARETNARRAEQYTAMAIYVGLFLSVLFVLMKEYGIRKGYNPDGLDKALEALLDDYPAAFTVYAARGEVCSHALIATLAELARRGVISISRDDKGVPRLRLNDRPDSLLAHEKAALDIIFSDASDEWVDLSSLYTPGDEAQARRLIDLFAIYNKAVPDDAHAAGLTWKNDALLIVTALLNILCGVIMGFVLLLVGKRMLLEACGVAVFMFVMIGQINRVRRLTDAGEALQEAAYQLKHDPAAKERHVPLSMAVDEWYNEEQEDGQSEEASLYNDIYSRLHEIYFDVTLLRKSRKKK